MDNGRFPIFEINVNIPTLKVIIGENIVAIFALIKTIIIYANPQITIGPITKLKIKLVIKKYGVKLLNCRILIGNIKI